MNEFIPLEKEVDQLFEKALSQTANQSALSDFHHLLQQCRRRIHQPMRVAIVGVIKAGKSTLMNALLQEKMVATGKVEATFNINWLKYAEQPALKVYFKDENRPPEAKSFSQLEALTLRPEEHQDYLLSIKYIEVSCPNPILKTFHIIDTPGLKSFYEEDSKNTQEFLQLHGEELTNVTQKEAANADAVLYLFSQSIGQGDAETLQAFQGPLAGNATPINAIGVLTKVDIYATDPNINNPMVAGSRVANGLLEKAQVRRLFYTIYPICGLLAEGSQTLSEKHLDILNRLAQLPQKRFKSLSRYTSKFTDPYELDDIPVSQDDRKAIEKQLGLYGVILAYELINSGINSREQLAEELLKKTGVNELRQLVLSHFGHRSLLIKLGKVLQDISSNYFQLRQRLQGEALDILEEISGQFDALQSKQHAFAELDVLRSHYEGKLNFDEKEEKQLLAVTGENGISCGERLELSEQATIEEMIPVAIERMQYWHTRANDYMSGDRATIAAATVLTRSYDRILYRLQKAKEYLQKANDYLYF
ncbi:GTP-binding protein HSR1-related [Gloeothece citriformis PCC 7424]|uniref:GTP-binding protein HSR1-related n=1 Tax=Gloeothece citriformis (strain PCC 7424) TaxID=65393 RepID=B7KJ10_GLOC7|nr:dynamin family protein [Gloeothece citriformis]ACK70846.1 GTP-binding protein HSR1-related [Gloeothece citriformis PCC 7424]